MRKIIFCLCCVLVLFATSCSKKSSSAIQLPDEFLYFSLKECALATEPYTSFYKEPSLNADIVAHARRGDVLVITGKKVDDAKNLWYQFDKGWIQAKSVQVYSNAQKATKASNALH